MDWTLDSILNWIFRLEFQSPGSQRSHAYSSAAQLLPKSSHCHCHCTDWNIKYPPIYLCIYPRIFAHLLSLSTEENSIVMKLYLRLGLCIALSLLGTVLSGPLTMEYNDEPEKFTIQSHYPMEYCNNDESEEFTIQSHNPMEYNDESEKFTIQSSALSDPSSKSIVNVHALVLLLH